jgi:hypothetical protein
VPSIKIFCKPMMFTPLRGARPLGSIQEIAQAQRNRQRASGDLLHDADL